MAVKGVVVPAATVGSLPGAWWIVDDCGEVAIKLADDKIHTIALASVFF